MQYEWSLRDEIFESSHRWPVVLAFLLVGAALGWAASLVWPSPYQATNELYVGLNTYRALQDRNVVEYANGEAFNHPDDYKNWQMADLNTILFMDEVINGALQRLQAQDAYWKQVDAKQFRQMAQTYWRNAGKWRLAIDHTDPQRAAQALKAWEESSLAVVGASIAAAQDTMLLDIQLQSLADQQASLQAEVQQARAALEQVQLWQTRLANDAANAALDPPDRAQLLALAQNIALQETAFPQEGATLGAYQTWLDAAAHAIPTRIEILNEQLAGLEKQISQTQADYRQAAKESRGLSAALAVEKTGDAPPLVRAERPTPLLALAGALLGLLAWAFFWLALPAFRKTKSS